jgi:hypothetical protein
LFVINYLLSRYHTGIIIQKSEAIQLYEKKLYLIKHRNAWEEFKSQRGADYNLLLKEYDKMTDEDYDYIRKRTKLSFMETLIL